jgi:hypothetical protein
LTEASSSVKREFSLEEIFRVEARVVVNVRPGGELWGRGLRSTIGFGLRIGADLDYWSVGRLGAFEEVKSRRHWEEVLG